jgi:hypothetical protein
MLKIASASMKNNWVSYPPRLLIDGNINNFAHTNGAGDGMWVRLTLTEQSRITKVIVYNRHNCCQNRIVGASLFIKMGDAYVTECGTIATVEDFYEFDCEGVGDMVELSQEGRVHMWNIAEIRIYGTPKWTDLNPG